MRKPSVIIGKLRLEMLALLEMGALCPVFLLTRLPGVKVSLGWLLLAAFLPMLLLWAARFEIQTGWIAAVLGLLLLSVLAAWLLRNRLIVQADRIYQGFLLLPEEEKSVTLLLSLGLILWDMLLFLLEGTLAGHFAASLLLLALLIGAPAFSLPVSAISAFLFLGFFFLFWLLHRQLRFHIKKESVRQRRPERMIHRWVGILAVLFLVCWLIASLVSRRWNDHLYQAVFDAEEFYYDKIDLFPSSSGFSGTNSEISRGNNYSSDVEYLHLYAAEQPKEVLYLKDFTGDVYVGNGWEKAEEEVETPQLDSPEGNNTLAVRALFKNSPLYVPYFGQPTKGFSAGRIPQSAAIYQYCESWNLPEPAEAEPLSEEAVLFYTAVPEERLPRLKKLAEDNPQDSYEEITTFILYTLQTRAVYSLKPGIVPLNEDTSEYFLFGGGRGFCEHFASAGALLYRLYGIPARYATGFCVNPEDFTMGPSGCYEAEVTNKSTHSWTEIYLPGYGWTPIDLTPKGDGMIHGAYPGFDPAPLKEMLQDYDPPRTSRWDTPIMPDLPEIPDPSDISYEYPLPTEPGEAHVSHYQPPLWLLISLLVILSAVLFCIFVDEYRAYKLDAMYTKPCSKLYAQLMSLLHAGGLSRKITGEEADIGEKMRFIFPDIDVERASVLTEKDSFSGKPLTADEREEMLQIVQGAVEKARSYAPWWKKFWLHWIKVYY